MDINQLHDDWITKGNKVTDLLEKKIAMNEKYNSTFANLNDEEKENFKNEMKKVSQDYKDAITARDFAKTTFEDAQAAEKVTNKKPIQKVKSKEEEIKEENHKLVSNIRNMVTTGKIPKDAETTTDPDGSNAGLTIPEDVQTKINKFIRQFASLENLVSVENVSIPSGSRIYEKLSEITPLTNLDNEAGKIPDNDDPSLVKIIYNIHRYAGISTATNTLIADSDENILSWLIDWVSRKDVITRNKAILDVMGNAPAKPTITNFDDIKDLENNTLDPLIIATSSYVTNQSGFNVLSKMKDADGRYLIQPNVTNPEVKEIGGHTVQVIGDKWLPDVSGSHPLYFGDLKQGITLYDRQRMSVTPTNIGGGAFETDTTKIRFIDRFDVELIDDGAFAAASFKNIASQATGTSSTDGKTSK